MIHELRRVAGSRLRVTFVHDPARPARRRLRSGLVRRLAGPTSRVAAVVELELEEIEKLSDRMSGLSVVSHRRLPIDRVAVPSSDALDRDEARLDEVCDDPLSCALGDANHLRDVSCPHVLVPGDAEKDLSVVRHEPPGLPVHIT